MKTTHTDKLSKWLEETDPEKWHAEATNVMKQLKDLIGQEGTEEAANLIYNAATFMETRACYLLLQRQQRNGTFKRNSC
ncbi:MAG: hypothetical protein G01um101444_29 [Parcubacteria group bacterium Gr01-1014_44]|nr:MAG: hypothetical protein G01um101444_29 [Parcubacteria group bacterium Gr01-1014_44]